MSRAFQWEGTNVPFPTTITWTNHDISTENSGRSKSGKMHKKNVAVKRELSCEWKMAPDSVSSSVLASINGRAFGDLKYPDAQTGTDIIKSFYTGDPEAELKFMQNGVCYWDISITFIEQ